MKRNHRVAVAALALSAIGAPLGAAGLDTMATKFGMRENVRDISISPDGRYVAVVAAGPGRSDVILSIDTTDGAVKRIGASDADPLHIVSCGWASDRRLVCKFAGISSLQGLRVGYSRTLGLDADGGHPLYLGRKQGMDALRVSQFDGDVIDWRGGDGSVLMTRDFVPQEATGSLARSGRDGLGVELVDTVTGKAQPVETPTANASDFIADGQGNVRIRVEDMRNDAGLLTGTTVYSYRLAGKRGWQVFSKWTRDNDALVPLAVDGGQNVAYAVRALDGRQALYRVALDGSMKTELASSSKEVDVNSVVSIGRHGRVIGATYITDRRQIDYFDPEYRKLAAALARALPKTPLIRFVGANADESRLLVFAGSDVDAGAYFVYNKADRHLDALIAARPQMGDMPLAEMKAITFKAADGAGIPAYLTLPPGGARTALPAIVLPHGGPGYRDEWGFDWLVQFFAQAGYAVLQPNFRGSTGYGDAWYAKNGFRSWQIAIGDVADAGRWLVKEGIADPARLGIVGWSYGGYAALQANVVDPTLFKAVVAIAPVTDLGQVKRDARGFSNAQLVAEQVGSGRAIGEGSPARHADRFVAPVLMFHGDRDLNVDVDQSRDMDAALRRAGKKSTLVVFPKLDHQIEDSEARTRMLGEADAFLKASFGK